MGKRVLFAVIAVFLLVRVISATKVPDSAWQTGILRSVTSDSTSRLHGVYNNGYGILNEKVRKVTHYTIEAEQYVYQADRTTGRHDKSLDVTINGPVKFAVVGSDLYLYDDSGKSHKLAIATKALRLPPAK